MNKSFLDLNWLIIFNIPLIINIFMMILISIPMKFNKFHPLKLSLLLIMLTFMISFKMNFYMKSWMNFFILLIIIGGLMIIFLYITSLNNNEFMKFNFKNIKINLIKFMILFIIMFFLFKTNFMFFNSQDMWNFNFNINEEKNNMSMMKLFNWHKNTILFLLIYLFYSMICIMNMCYKMKMSLRQINY